jgi:hypothetical protein
LSEFNVVFEEECFDDGEAVLNAFRRFVFTGDEELLHIGCVVTGFTEVGRGECVEFILAFVDDCEEAAERRFVRFDGLVGAVLLEELEMVTLLHCGEAESLLQNIKPA